MTKKREKNILGQKLSQLLESSQKNDKKREKKIEKNIYGSELSEANNEPTLRWHQKNWKKSKIIFGSELSEANNEPTIKIRQKIDKNREKKKSKNYFWVKIFWNDEPTFG